MSTTQNGLASRDNWRADHHVVPKMPALTSSRAEVEGSRRVILKVTSAGSPFPSRFDALQRCDVVSPFMFGTRPRASLQRFCSRGRRPRLPAYFKSPRARRVASACTASPQIYTLPLGGALGTP